MRTRKRSRFRLVNVALGLTAAALPASFVSDVLFNPYPVSVLHVWCPLSSVQWLYMNELASCLLAAALSAWVLVGASAIHRVGDGYEAY